MRSSNQATPDSAHSAGNDILRAIRRIIRSVALQSKRLSRETGLTLPQILCLRAIADAPNQELTGAALSEQVQLSPATISGIIDRLERAGLVLRQRWATDRRKVSASLTAQGRERLATLPVPLQEKVLERIIGLTPEQRQELMDSLDLLVELMEAGELDASPILVAVDELKKS